MSLKPLPAEKIIRVLKKVGFEIVRQKGSHVILKNPEGRITVVPLHKGEEIGRGLLLKIIKDAGLKKEEFLDLIRK
ncbi:MAG: type II toxin-antitoxin system HicA family toxin [Candidatus Freyarchaeum deiterrae]